MNVLCLDIVYFMAKEKARFFTFLLDPDGEGFPSDWEIRLELIGQPIAISPLHDQDKDKKNGGYKKRHYHGIYVANNPVTADSVRVRIQRALSSEVEECKAIARVQIVRTSIENVYLYLTHESKDAVVKKKHRYDKEDIKHLNCFDISRYVVLDTEVKGELFNVVVSIIRIYMLENIFDLYDFVDEYGENYGLTINIVNEVIQGKTGFMKLLFDGAYQRRKRGQGPKENLVSEE